MFDVYFQDDGSRQERYTPYSANSGFYFVRNNDRTRLLFRHLLYSGDLIIKTRSHQQILIAMLAEHNSVSGLRVKVLSRDGEEFPSGYHYHSLRDTFMRKFVGGGTDSWIFHMCWTLNKDDKLKFLSQMGMWHVEDKCIGKEAGQISDGGKEIAEACCSAKPLTKCHYRDKPAIVDCSGSPPKDKNGRTWWK